MDLNQFATWQVEKPDTRCITIKAGHGEELNVWVFDRKLMIGQYAKSVDEIDLEAEKAADEKAEFERLRAKYEVAK